MSDKPVPPLPAGILTDEQLAKIGGGDCSIQDYISMLDTMKDTYEKAIDFTVYVMERVAGP